MGCAPQKHWSGDVKKHTKAGSSFIKSALHLWILTTLVHVKSRPATEACQKLARILDEGKENGTPTLLLWAKVKAVAMEILFDRLVAKMAKQPDAIEASNPSSLEVQSPLT